MKLILVRVIVVLILGIKTEKALASHAMGGQITYECISANQYKIKLTLFRDCSGIPLNSLLQIEITNSCGFLTPSSLSVNLVGNPQTISTACQFGLTVCDGGFEFGFQRHVYEGTLTLPGDCQDWTLSHTVINRNSVTTTVGTSNDSLYIYSVINNTNSICNNSPNFSNSAAASFYLGYPTCYDHGAYDSEGDSLAFELTTPRTGPSIGDTVEYLSGYSVFNPIQSAQPITFSPSNGAMCFNPTFVENSIFAVIISEFRNGVLIGKVERDIQLRTLLDPVINSTPVLSGIDGTSSFIMSACPNIPINFFIPAFDSNATEDIRIYWTQPISGATFVFDISTVSNADTAYFSWTPTLSDVSTTPHCFKAIVHDYHCPYTAVDSQLFCIVVKPPNDPFCLNPGIDENIDELSFQVYPNPANDLLKVIVESEKLHNANLFVFNSIGQEILSNEISFQGEHVFNISSWPRGIYEVVLVNTENRTGKRILIQ
ncbi:MAG: T9SS type A sorting domain-containing protein [Bacteroidia bacterium]|nr:T9SS type A sorting domain-containing protein [Bacteroidia bacterium]